MESFSALLAIRAGNSPGTGEFPHKGQCRGALMFSLKKKTDWVNNREAGDLRRQRYYTHYDVTVMFASNGDKNMDCKFVSGKGIQFYLHMRYRQKYGKSEKHNWNARI